MTAASTLFIWWFYSSVTSSSGEVHEKSIFFQEETDMQRDEPSEDNLRMDETSSNIDVNQGFLEKVETMALTQTLNIADIAKSNVSAPPGNFTSSDLTPDILAQYVGMHSLIGSCLSLEKILSSFEENSDENEEDYTSIQPEVLRDVRNKLHLQILLDSYCSRRENVIQNTPKRLEFHDLSKPVPSVIPLENLGTHNLILVVFNVSILLLCLLFVIVYLIVRVKKSRHTPLIDFQQANSLGIDSRSINQSHSSFTLDLKRNIFQRHASLTGSFFSLHEPLQHNFNNAGRTAAASNSFYFTHFIHKCIIGKGGCGAVFLAEHRTTGINYAVKIVAISSSMSERIRSEASMHASLDHVNVVRYFSSWEDKLSDIELRKLHLVRISTPSHQSSGETFSLTKSEETSFTSSNVQGGTSTGLMTMNFLFIQMCYYEHGTLRDRLSRTDRKVNFVENMVIFQQLTSGLLYLHSQGILHRDLKPGNIFISYTRIGHNQEDESLCIKIGDFGLSVVKTNKPYVKHTEGDHTKSSSERTAGVGTPAYCSPEQLSSGRVSEASDVFALGIIMLECFVDVPTESEKYAIFESARKGHISASKHEVARQYSDIVELIMQMIYFHPEKRIPLRSVKDKVDLLLHQHQNENCN